MKKLPLAANMLLYQFLQHDGDHFGYNIVALLDESEKTALLIDTAWEEEAAAVRNDLEADGYKIERVILSHFHDDHLFGLRSLPGVERIGSKAYETDLHKYSSKDNWSLFSPTTIIDEDSVIRFGNHLVTFRHAPGHSPCSIYSIVNDAFVHVADNIMTSNDGHDLLPWATFENVLDHIHSLELLREYAGHTILPSHGTPIEEESVLLEAIGNRVKYLQAVHEGNGAICFEEAAENCTCDFLYTWHIVKED